MRAFFILASLSVLVFAESPTGYSHRSSSSELNFQSVPSVAQLHIPPSASPRSLSVSSSHSSSRGLTAGATSPIARYAVPPPSLTAAAASTGPSSSQHLHHHHQQTTAYSSPQAVYAAPTTAQAQPTAYAAPTSQQASYATAYTSQQAAAPQLQTFSYPQVHIQTEPQYAAAPTQVQSSSQQQQQYSLPPQQVQVNYGAPPPLPAGASYGPPPVVTGAGPDHNIEYRVVYVKGPKGPSPDVVLPPPPPKQKTIVYILIPRIEKPDPILIQPPPSTPPSKPEVYFIRYKAKKNNKNAPSSEYGAPFGSASAPKPVVVEASNRKRSTDAVNPTTTRTPARPTTTAASATTTDSSTFPTVAYGERVRKQ